MKAREQIDAVLKYLYDNKDNKSPVLLNDILGNKNLLEICGNEGELTRMINKLLSDKYCHRYPDYPLFEDGKKDMRKGLLTYCPITFDGRLFWENGGYTKDLQRKKIIEFPKNYWWLIAIFAFVIGFFADVVKEQLKQRKLPASSQQQPTPPIVSDTAQNHKTY